jgi:hypothetical protein
MRSVMRLIFVSSFLVSLSHSQEAVHTSTLTLGVGGESRQRTYPQSSAGPAFKINYEFRLAKYFAVEAGTEMLFPKTVQFQPAYVILSGTNLTNYFNGGTSVSALIPSFERRPIGTVPFGIKGILPLAHGRLELFAGVGGAYGWNYSRYLNSWYGQTSLGGRFALDRRERFWVGTSGRYANNFSNTSRQSWLTWTADFSVRFGH